MKKAGINRRKRNGKELYRSLLLSKKADLVCSLGLSVNSIARNGPVSEEDQAQLSHEEFISLRLNGLDYEKLRLVEEALDRLDAGEYGICLACEKPIPPKRLQALPWAMYCISCQEQMATIKSGRPESSASLSEALSSG